MVTLCLIVAMIAVGIFLILYKTFTPEFNFKDYKADPADYRGLKEITDFSKQVKVGHNFAAVYIVIKQENKTQYIDYVRYLDFDNDLYIDEYTIINFKIANKKATAFDLTSFAGNKEWKKDIAKYYRPSGKYADKQLQKIINADYKILRKKGKQVDESVMEYEQTFVFETKQKKKK